MGFLEKLQARRQETGALLCVGLDPDVAKIPESVRRLPEPLLSFCTQIVQATSAYACAYKPNLAFFEAHGSLGIAQLERLLSEVPPDIPTILDGKRGDIGNSSRLYARFLFEHLKGDAATVNPYLGRDSLEPFFEFPGRVPFVLCLTSNPGSVDIQTVVTGNGEDRVYHRVIHLLQRMRGSFGLVVGAQHAEMIEDVRRRTPDAPLLIPGVGAQGGDLEATLRVCRADSAPALINVSRDILYASSGEDFAEAAANKAWWYVEQMKQILAG